MPDLIPYNCRYPHNIYFFKLIPDIVSNQAVQGQKLHTFMNISNIKIIKLRCSLFVPSIASSAHKQWKFKLTLQMKSVCK